MRLISSTILSAGLFLLTLVPAGDAHILTKLQPPQVTQSKQPQNTENDEQLQEFTGTIVSMTSGILILKDDAKSISYGLDNQGLARTFADKKVVVTGTLEKTDTIRIKSIEEQKT